MTNKIKHIIWDYNGTLLNDVGYCVNTMNTILSSRNLPELTIEKYQELFDFPVKNYYEKLGFDFENDTFEKVSDEFIEKYDASIKKSKLFSQTVDVLTKISEKNITQYVLSARNIRQLTDELKFFKIYNFFKEVKGLDDDFGGGKIAKGEELLKNIDAKPEEIVLIGDTTHDFEVAQKLGIQSILISQGHHSKEKLQACNVLHVSNLGEFLSLFENKNATF